MCDCVHHLNFTSVCEPIDRFSKLRVRLSCLYFDLAASKQVFFRVRLAGVLMRNVILLRLFCTRV